MKLFFKIYEGLARLIVTPLVALFPFLFRRVRFLQISYSWFGHLALDPDNFVKMLRLGEIPDAFFILVVRPDKTCNRSLLEYWRPYFHIVDSPLAYWLYPFSRIKGLSLDVHAGLITFSSASSFAETERKWIGKPPLLKLSADHITESRKTLATVGIPEDAWFVCFHARESGFKDTRKERLDGDTLRNVDVTTYFKTMEAVVERGGWCIRIGDPSMQPLPPMKNVWDYAHSPLKSNALDVFILGGCRMMIGSTSGPTAVASAFGRPVGQSNCAPIGYSLPVGWRDMGIPKLYFSRKENRFLSFREAFAQRLAFLSEFEQEGIEVVPSTEDEILDLFLDLWEDAEAGHPRDPEKYDESTRRYLGFFDSFHYSFQAPAIVSPRFLRRHRDLLD